MANQATPAKKGFFARTKDYFKSVVSELKKVTWPSKKEICRYVVVVIGVCAAFALLFWLIDTAILALLGLIMG